MKTKTGRCQLPLPFVGDGRAGLWPVELTTNPGLKTAPRPPVDAAAPKWSVYFFGGGNVNLVARDITLDGNTWRDSRSVDKEWFVPAAEVGMAVAFRRLTAAFAYVFWGREFKGQKDYSEFGALTVSYRF